jgi:integrin beta 1
MKISAFYCSFLFTIIISIQFDKTNGNMCISNTNCKECITSEHLCAWCTQPGELTEESTSTTLNNRCDYIENVKKYCKKEFIYSPENSYKILNDEPFKPLDADGSAVQIKPQRINVKLRPHSPVRFNISYQLAEDYPVDLYFLMDLSNSMDVHKDKLSQLGHVLATSMRNITKNFRLGFGSFVEKETLPFVNTAPRSLSNPCLSSDQSGMNQCVQPYGYIHHMTLTDNSTLFETEVKSAKVSGNLDSPEGGLDALMQVIVCENEVGWRPASRKLIVYSTDAGFHYAGDGKLAGIIEPNDGACHLNSKKRYTHGLIQDYPSIGEINHKIIENNVNLIFAVVKDQAALYKNLSEAIEGSFVGELDNDSSNIVKLVVDIYKTIANKIVFTTEALPDGVEVKFLSKCQNRTNENNNEGDDQLKETNFCDGLRIKEKVDFEVEIKMTKCPANRKTAMKPIILNAQGIGERVVIDIDALCDCDCERDDQNDNNLSNSLCNGRGRVICGICECDSEYYGNKCECSKMDSASDSLSNINTGNKSSCMK